MIEIGIGTIVGGFVGVVIGAILGDPFRDNKGRYVNARDGYVNWILKILITGAAGAMIGTWAERQIMESPILILVVAVIGYLIYRVYIDPRTG